MPIALRNTRLSLVAGQCHFEQGWRGGRRRPPWDFFEYTYTFNQIRGGGGDPNYTLPWRPAQNNNFWSQYLGGRKLGRVPAEEAWQAMVPFRLVAQNRPAVSIDKSAERLFYDIYAYPHGLAAILTIQSPPKSAETIDDWRDRTRRLRLDRVFLSSRDGPQIKLNATEALASLLDWHRDAFYGKNIGDVHTSSDPISLGVVVQGDGADPKMPIDDTLHRNLYAVTGWP